jgi:hypothetical protein
MKIKILVLFVFITLSMKIIAQSNVTEITARVKGGSVQLYYGDVKINYAKAKNLSLEKSNEVAFEYFKKAKNIRTWDLVWSSVGTTYFILGLSPLSYTRVAVGITLMAVPYFPGRSKRFVLYTNKAVEAFNTSK